MTDIKFKFSFAKLSGLGDWLDSNIPNPPLPEVQRWSIIESEDDGLACIRFFHDQDATLFSLRWL